MADEARGLDLSTKRSQDCIRERGYIDRTDDIAVNVSCAKGQRLPGKDAKMLSASFLPSMFVI